jgi:ferredoxin-NADP reductase
MGQQVKLAQRRLLSDGVVELVLEPAGEEGFPSWGPGAHIDLFMPSGLVRQYSLCGDPADARRLRVAVLREVDGRGGSVEVHDVLQPGVELSINGPRNHFELEDATQYVFVAGGIGITPILAMTRAAVHQGAEWILYYGGRTARSMAYVDELEQLVERSAGRGRLVLVPEDELGRLDLDAIFASAEGGIPIYACGPEPLLEALEERAERDLEPHQLHLERFGAAPGGVATDDGALEHFEIVIASTGAVLPVGPDDRMIDVVRTVAPQVPFSCEEGYCGSCETGVVEGVPCHRDTILTDDERESNETMMICVGRALSRRITLDL